EGDGDRWRIGCSRQLVVEEMRVELPAPAVHSALAQRDAEAVYDAALHLPLGAVRIDDPAAVVNGDVSEHTRNAGFPIDSDMRYVTPERARRERGEVAPTRAPGRVVLGQGRRWSRPAPAEEP